MSAETPTKSPGRRLLRKSALQASPFGAPIKPFHGNNNISGGNGSSKSGISMASPLISTARASTSSVSSSNPFLSSPSATSTAQKYDLDADDAAMPDSPSSRRSARLSNTHINYNYNTNGYSNPATSASHQGATPVSILSPRKQGLHASAMPLPTPTTPKKKTRLSIWGQVVGLKKQDESVYYRYPIDKSYCSFGRNRLNDVSFQIDSVSEHHCKLIRRDDGEVWLKDTSTNGTLLNNVLVHDTARPIHHNDILTIGGRKFRFECVEPQTSTTLGAKSPSKHIGDIQLAIENDIKSLENMSSASTSASSNPQRRTSVAHTAVSLDASLGFFTPKKAARLSSLLVSPKPVPLPAFLAKSPNRLNSPALRKGPILDDELDAHKSGSSGSSLPAPRHDEDNSDNPFLDPPSVAVSALASAGPLHPGLLTPTRGKRVMPEDFDEGIMRTPKKVSFGPALSPEIFDQSNPPSTPVRRGQQQDPDTPRRLGVSTPSLLSRLQSVDSPSKSILSPSKPRQTHLVGLEKPAPINFFSPGRGSQFVGRHQEQSGGSPSAIRISSAQDAKVSAFLASPSPSSSRSPFTSSLLSMPRSPQLSRQSSGILGSSGVVSMSSFLAGTSQGNPSNSGPVGSPIFKKSTNIKGPGENRSTDIGLWKKLTPLETATKEAQEGPSAPSVEDEEESNESTPSSPTKATTESLVTIPTTPSQHGAVSPNVMLQEHTHHVVKLKTSSSTLSNKEPLQKQDEQPSVTPAGTAPSTPEKRTPSPSPSVVASNPLYSDENNPFDVTGGEQGSDHYQESTWTAAVRQELAPPHISELQDLDDSDSVVNTPTHRSRSSSDIAREPSLSIYRQKVKEEFELKRAQESGAELEEEREEEEEQEQASELPTLTSTVPVSPSRLALLQLSAQKIQGLADLLHSPPSSSKQVSKGAGSVLARRPRLSLPPSHSKERREELLPSEADVKKRTSDVDAEDDEDEKKSQSQTDGGASTSMLTSIDLNFGRVSLPGTSDAKKRRLSAPGALTTTQGPTLFSGLRGVLRTPQRIFAGFRNLVRTTPTATRETPAPVTTTLEATEEKEKEADDDKAPSSPLSRKSLLQKPQEVGGSDNDITPQSSESIVEGASSSTITLSTSIQSSAPLTPRRRIAPHQDMMAILLGRSPPSNKEPSSSVSALSEAPAEEPKPLASRPFASLFASTSLETLRARGRKTDTFPQKKLMMSRTESSNNSSDQYLYSAGEESTESDERKKRRRTMSDFTTSESSTTAQDESQEQEQGQASINDPSRAESDLYRLQDTVTASDSAVSVDKEESENDGQAELLRLLDDEGAIGGDDDLDQEDSDAYAYEDGEPAVDEEADDRSDKDASETKAQEDDEDNEVVFDGARTPPPVGSTTQTSLTSTTTTIPLTPIRRRTSDSLRRRLGSASPAFRRYERTEGDDEEGEEAEEDMVVMLSPKQVRVRSIFGNRR